MNHRAILPQTQTSLEFNQVILLLFKTDVTLAALPSPAPPGLMEKPYEYLSVRVLRAPTHCPALRQGLQPYAHLSWGLHRTCTSPQGIRGLNALRNAVTSLFFFFF